MSLRGRLLLIFGTIVVVTVALIAYVSSVGARKVFQRLEYVQIETVSGQFGRQFDLQRTELALRASAITGSTQIREMAVSLSSGNADPSAYLNLAGTLAAEQELDFLELLAQDGTIISSAQAPASFGLRDAWVEEVPDWNKQPAFLQYIQPDQERELAMLAVRRITVGDHSFYVVAGRRIDCSTEQQSGPQCFLQTIVLPKGTRLFLWMQTDKGVGRLQDTAGPFETPASLSSLIQQTHTETLTHRLRLDDTADGDVIARSIPLSGRNSNQPLAVLIVTSSRRELVDLQARIRNTGFIVALGGILLSVLASGWWATRISRPIEELSTAAQDVAAGDWQRKVEIGSVDEKDEVARLIQSFNQMTEDLLKQRDRALQAERVAAWRELARRLAHELKNPLFPLQITVENLMTARQQNSPEFNEIFAESTTTLLAELSNLKKIIGRFSDFSRMPAPQLQKVDLNRLLDELARLFAPQLAAAATPIKLESNLTKVNAIISGDADLLRRAFENLILNAIDAMPEGGTLRLSTTASDANVTVEIADTGAGLNEEEASRLFTPYYTTKQHGTGLGLAIVQSVISDHGASISVQSRPGKGTAFRIEFHRNVGTGVFDDRSAATKGA